MFAVTCFQCGHAVEISPDSDRCELCGANLRKLIGVHQATSFFYQRAAGLATRGDPHAALAEAERGLAYRASAELHLLSAILCKRLDLVDRMRYHVASVPVDDVLRSEAEWLLRSSQARQRSLPKSGRGSVEFPLLSDDELLPLYVDDVRPTARLAASRPPLQRFAMVFSAAVLLGTSGWWFWQTPPQISVSGQPPVVAATPEQVRWVPDPTPTVAVADLPDLPEELPQQPVLPNEPLAATDLEPLAAAGEAILLTGPAFDVKTVLVEAQRPELAESVNGRLEGNRLVLEGSVASVEARNELIQLLSRLPAIEDVSVVNVLVRPLNTYIVVEGDTLWGISMKLYGTPDRIQDIFAANQAVLPAANALQIGMELQIPE